MDDRRRARAGRARCRRPPSCPARWLGADADLGTLEAGKRADLVALGADPLADAKAWRTIGLVMKGGEVVRNDGWPR